MKFCFHKWLPWSDPIQSGNSGHKQQWRVCKHCNKAQFRTLFWDKQSSIQAVIAALNKTRELIGIKGEA